ncbi:MAG: hypothetical protein ACK476_14580 [Fluviicola sp.]|jgi:hypothetical protein
MNKKLVLFFLFVLIVSIDFGQGCSQCKLLTEQGSENALDEQSFGTNINYGILYLLIIPYMILMFLFRKQIGMFFKSLFKK